jgi:hypothetical protein
MADLIYWGEGGQYGPYSEQDDGWPNAGEVMRDFRERLSMGAGAFAALYSEGLKKLDKTNKKGRQGKQGQITAVWVLNMEKQNRVPTDIERRRLIAELLRIPPALLGLAALETVNIQPREEKAVPTLHTPTIKRVPIDIDRYKKNIRVTLSLHNTSNAHSLFDDVKADLHALSCLENQAGGDLLYQIRELLVSNNLLAARIARDKRKYDLAYAYTNNAVHIATNMEDDELLVAAWYTRGSEQFARAQFGTMRQGIFQIDRDKIQDAMHDFQAIVDKAKAQPESLHPQLQGLAMLQLARAMGLLKQGNRDPRIVKAQTLTDHAADMVGQEQIDDLYTRALITGTLSGLHSGGYLLYRAHIFITLGMPGKALLELNQIQQLSERTYRKDETRIQAWFDIVVAEAQMGLREYAEATSKATSALIACHNITSMQNIAMIADLQSRLAGSTYGSSQDVKELGDMLREWYGSH